MRAGLPLAPRVRRGLRLRYWARWVAGSAVLAGALAVLAGARMPSAWASALLLYAFAAFGASVVCLWLNCPHCGRTFVSGSYLHGNQFNSACVSCGIRLDATTQDDSELRRWLVGCWQLRDVDQALNMTEPVEIEFKPGGELLYCVDVGERWQIERLNYRVEGSTIISTAPPAPLRERTAVFFEGQDRLVLDYGAAKAGFARGARRAPLG